MTGAVTSATGGLAGISGRHLLQTSPPPPVTTQLTSAATDAGNTVVSSVQSLLETLELEPQPEPASRHLLQATPPPVTGDAALVNTVGAPPVLGTFVAFADLAFPCLYVSPTVLCATNSDSFQHVSHAGQHSLTLRLCAAAPAIPSERCRRDDGCCHQRHWWPRWHQRAPPPADLSSSPSDDPADQRCH